MLIAQTVAGVRQRQMFQMILIPVREQGVLHYVKSR
jgi:hypothetical protein